MFGKSRKLLSAGVSVSGFRLPRLDGRETSLEDITAAGPALLAFFKVSCPVCQLALPYLERIHSPGRLSVYGMSQNDPEDTREFNRRFGVTFPVLLDKEETGFQVSNTFGISSVPTLFLVERDGTVSRVIEGWNKIEVQRLGAQAGVNPFREGESVPDWKAG